jgi:Dihaem cytochrome c
MMPRSLRAALLPVLLALAGAALADGPRSTPLLSAYRDECGSCHVAFPPSLLNAGAWQRVMGGLARHYGTDASVDAATAAQISAWLQASAGSGRRASDNPPEDRITRSAWFVREHDEVSASAWHGPAVKSAANCSACHARAEQGAYDERDIRIPR